MRCCLFVLFVLLAGVPPVGAQVLEPPPRASRGLFGGGPPPDPNRVQNDLTLRVNFLGGYDDNVSPPGTSDAIALTRPSGYTGLTDVQLIYDRGNQERSVDVNGRGYMNAYRNVGLKPTYGGELSVRAHTKVNRRDELAANVHSSYDPYFSLGAFNQPSPEGTVGVPTSNQSYALDKSLSWSLNADTSYSHQWTERGDLSGSYSFAERTFDSVRMFDSHTNAGSVSFGAPIGERLSLDTSYRYADNRFVRHDAAANRRTIVDQTIDGGLRYEKRLSATRQLTLAGGAGGLHINGTDFSLSQTFSFWEPSGYGRAQFDFHRSWSLSGEYRRALSLLQGLTPDPFIQNTATISLGGYLMQRLEGVFETGYAKARAGFSAGPLGPGRFDSYSGTAQLRVQVTRTLSAVVIYNHYQYQLDQAAQESLHTASPVRRNAVRIGVNWQQPLMTSRRPEQKRVASEKD